MVVGWFQWIHPKTVDGSKRGLCCLWPPWADVTPWDCVGLGFEVESKTVATLGTGVCQLFWLLMLCKAHANICQTKDRSTSSISLPFGIFLRWDSKRNRAADWLTQMSHASMHTHAQACISIYTLDCQADALVFSYIFYKATHDQRRPYTNAKLKNSL